MDITLNGATRVFVMIGYPVAQVESPAGLTPIMQKRGHNAVLIPLEIAPEDFDAAVTTIKTINNLDGFAVTVPHKFALFKHVDRASDRASFLGAANMLRREKDGLWMGDHSDGPGFLGGMRAAGCDPKGKRALLIGAGGSGSAIALELLEKGVSEIAIQDIKTDRRDDLIKRLNTRYPGRALTGSQDPQGFDIVINATSLGMNPTDPLPVDTERLAPTAFAGDVVTDPAVTPFIENARKRGCKTQTGTGMFNAMSGIMADFLLGGG